MKKLLYSLSVFCFLFFVISTYVQSNSLLDGVSSDIDEVPIVDFNVSEIFYDVDCDLNRVNIFNINISSEEEVSEVSYSVDGGLTWDTKSSLSFDLLDVPFGLGMLVLKLKVNVGSEVYTSVDKYISTDCSKDSVYGYYFESNGEPVMMYPNGEILFNPNHDLDIFIETSHTFNSVVVNVISNFGIEEVSLLYNYSTKLWSGSIPSDYLDYDELAVNVVAGEVIFELPAITNVKYIFDSSDLKFSFYEIYYFDGYKWLKMDYSSDVIKYPMFTLLPGEYYVRLRLNTGWYYSNLFELEEREVVSFSISEDNRFPRMLRWLESYFVPLEMDSLGLSLIDSAQSVCFSEDLELYLNRDKSFFFMYMNSWNPYYKSYLNNLQLFMKDYPIVVFTDQQNFNGLFISLKKYGEDIKLYQLDNDSLGFFSLPQPNLCFYDHFSNRVFCKSGFVSIDTFEDLVNNSLE